jgi:hypothetical protein
MATIKDAIRATELAGTKIDKQKLLEAIKHAAEKEFPFARDGSGYAVIRVRLP